MLLLFHFRRPKFLTMNGWVRVVDKIVALGYYNIYLSMYLFDFHYDIMYVQQTIIRFRIEIDQLSLILKCAPQG